MPRSGRSGRSGRRSRRWSTRGDAPCAGGAARPFNAPRRGAGVLLATLLALGAPRTAEAEEPRSATEPRIMQEPGDFTNVVDAFDEGDPFDLTVTLGYESRSKDAKIRRETHIADPGLATGGFTARNMDVAAFEERISRLNTRLDLGLYKDVALVVRLPIVLSHTRELKDLNGSSGRLDVVAAGAPNGGNPERLFSIPFKSPDRSGIEYLAVGLDVGIFNQARDRTKPTWVIGAEGRFNVSEPMRACRRDAPTEPPPPLPNNGPPGGASQVACADPQDINRDGVSQHQRDGWDFEGITVPPRKPGVSRGTTGLEGHVYVSRRAKYVEPYGGFSALFEFQTEASDYGQTDFEGSLVNHPPLVGSMILGLQVIPWEHRENFARLTFDLRFTGQYRSEGRDYSELFDALGSSDAPSLRNPTYSKFQANPNGLVDPVSVINPGSQKVYFTGLTDVQQHGTFRGSASITWQASEYVKFQLGAGYQFDQSHGITMDQPCNPDLKDRQFEHGPCHAAVESGPGQTSFTATGIPNPNYRPTINAVGRRFYVNDSFTVDLFANLSAMF